ncbi:CAP domain-containing protein [Demequina maris]|uniref:CAP domain-containing protein n=1 Tax=Demequina maris TaxID=1638982 RepID=UPI0007804B81|nr:CAP domain-containing protein [Demequina maris]
MRPSATAVPHTLASKAVLALIGVLVVALGLTGGPADAAVDPMTKVLQRTNTYRADEGLKPLNLRTGIVDVSQGWSGHMKSTRTLAHNPNFSSEMPSGLSSAAENVGYACGYGTKAANTNAIMSAWLKSAGHEANITGNYTDIGIGVAYDKSSDCAWATQNFGKYPLSFNKAPRPQVNGTLKMGNYVAAKTGTWRPSPNFQYRWFRDGKLISGATGKTYKLRWADKGHTIKVKVIAKKSGYKTTKRMSVGVKFS